MVSSQITDRNYLKWVSAFGSIKVTERPVEGLHARIGYIMKRARRATTAYLSNEIRFHQLCELIRARPDVVRDAAPRLFLIEKTLGLRREVLKSLNLQATDKLNALYDRELTNLLYRDDIWLKHAQKIRLRKEISDNLTRPRAVAAMPITANPTVQLLVKHLLEASQLHMAYFWKDGLVCQCSLYNMLSW